jgi:hypothetical protein
VPNDEPGIMKGFDPGTGCPNLNAVAPSKLIRRAPEIKREIRDRLDVAVYGSLSVITTLEFFEHHFA